MEFLKCPSCKSEGMPTFEEQETVVWWCQFCAEFFIQTREGIRFLFLHAEGRCISATSVILGSGL